MLQGIDDPIWRAEKDQGFTEQQRFWPSPMALTIFAGDLRWEPFFFLADRGYSKGEQQHGGHRVLGWQWKERQRKKVRFWVWARAISRRISNS